MWRRRKALARLHEELRIIELFDRIHSYAIGPDHANNAAHALRQLRRSQIVDEIGELRAYKAQHGNGARIGSAAVLLLCAVGYALHYLLS